MPFNIPLFRWFVSISRSVLILRLGRTCQYVIGTIDSHRCGRLWQCNASIVSFVILFWPWLLQILQLYSRKDEFQATAQCTADGRLPGIWWLSTKTGARSFPQANWAFCSYCEIAATLQQFIFSKRFSDFLFQLTVSECLSHWICITLR